MISLLCFCNSWSDKVSFVAPRGCYTYIHRYPVNKWMVIIIRHPAKMIATSFEIKSHSLGMPKKLSLSL